MEHYELNREDLLCIGIYGNQYEDLISLAKLICERKNLSFDKCINIKRIESKYYAPKISFDIK